MHSKDVFHKNPVFMCKTSVGLALIFDSAYHSKSFNYNRAGVKVRSCSLFTAYSCQSRVLLLRSCRHYLSWHVYNDIFQARYVVVAMPTQIMTPKIL